MAHKWLDEHQQRAWRAWLTVCQRAMKGQLGPVDGVIDNEQLRTMFLEEFRKRLKSLEMGDGVRRWVRLIGTVGMISRMLIAIMIGVFLIAAARLHDANQAVGIDGALRRLATRAYGPTLLVAVKLY